MWKFLYTYVNNITAEIQNAVLIQMPKKSEFEEFSFWHPSKLVLKENSFVIKMIFNKDFKFKLLKFEKGYKKKILEEKILFYDEIIKIFQAGHDHIVLNLL